jgi:hypothetical protein
MKRLLSWAAMGLLVSGSVGAWEARAQTGNPTAPQPGGANTPSTVGAPGRTQQPRGAGTTVRARAPGTTVRARGTSPTVPAGTAAGATRLGTPIVDPSTTGAGINDGSSARSFGANAGTFDRGPTTGTMPGSAFPGRANFSRGSTSATFRPAGPIVGGPNNAWQFNSQGNATLDVPQIGNRGVTGAFQDDFGAVITGPLGPGAPFIRLAPQTFVAPASPAAPISPSPDVTPARPIPADAQASGRTGTATGVPAAPQEPAVEPQDVATATAFPSRNPTANGSANMTSSASTLRRGTAQAVEIPAGGGAPRTTGFRGAGETPQNGGPTFVYPGYTLWQGYYWYHSPSAGWHYWDGSRWTRF